MSFHSLDFLLFFPLVTVIYYLIPKRFCHLWLLIASYYFYMCWNAKYALLLLFSTVVTYGAALLIEYWDTRPFDHDRIARLRKVAVALSLILNLAMLFFFKYFDFAAGAMNRLFALAHIQLEIPAFDVLLPIGISFYALQALGYTMDVYRREIPAERNFFRYALFVSFFPQLVAGPIERSKNLLEQFKKPLPFSFDRFLHGILTMIWGYFLKLVLADRIAIFVDAVYGDYMTFGGLYIAVATVLFAFQIYCDFYGYSVIATGAAQILGIRLMDNFNAPYLASSVTDFWRRWHVSLSSWFRDYLYFPLGGNKMGRAREYLNRMIVFLISGLWHGAQFSFIAWGGLNGLYQIIGSLLKPIRDSLVRRFHLDRNALSHRIFKIIFTFLLVDFSFIFFRAEKLTAAFQMIRRMFTEFNPWILFDGSLYKLGLDRPNFQLMLLGLFVLLFADLAKYRNIRIRERIERQETWFRVLTVALSIFVILLFGIYGTKYNTTNFIYFQF